jgi:succinyl-diaminopimelate desuccinylase
VVPATGQNWQHDPFGAEIEGDVMFGRGTVDMKSGATAMIIAMCLLKKAGVPLTGKVTFIHTAGEEVHFTGSASYVEKHGVEDMDAIAISEPSDNRIFVAERGGLWVKFTSFGKTAHAGLPDEGINALLPMFDLIHTLINYKFPVDKHPLLGKPTLSLTTIHGGTNTNVIPERCEATVDIRTIPGISHQTVLSDIDDIIRKMKSEDRRLDIVAEPINDHEPIETDVDNEFAQAAFQTFEQVFQKQVDPGGAYYITDAVSFLRSKSIPMIIFGPGDTSLIHKPDEHVSLSQVCDAVKFYVALAINYLG